MNTVYLTQSKGIRFKEFIFPLLAIFSLFDAANLLAGKEILGVENNLSLGDVGISSCLFAYIIFFRKEILGELLRVKWIAFIGILFLATTLLTSLIDNPYWVISVKYWIKGYTLFFLLVVIFRTSFISRHTLNLFCVIIIFLNLIGVLEYFYFGKGYMNEFLAFFRTKELLNGSNAVSSVFVNQNIYGVLNALFLVALLSIKLNYRDMINRYFFVIMLILSTAGIFLSTSRNAILILLVGLAFLIPFLKKNIATLKRLALIFIILSASFLIFIKYDPLFVNRYGNLLPFATRIAKGESVSSSDFKMKLPGRIHSRLFIWKTGIQKFKEKPLTGWGTGMSWWRLRDVTKHNHLHNSYLEILVSNGTPGFMLILCLMGLWLSRLKSPWCWSPVAALLIMCMFETFFVISTWVVFAPWIVAITTKDLIVTANGKSPESIG